MLLNGKWKLYPIETVGIVKEPDELVSYKSIAADVPGNVEIDLINSGLLPSDIFKGMNIREVEKLETYEWWYEVSFITPDYKERAFMKFCGVDCFAKYYINGKIIGESSNALIEHDFDVTDYLNDTGCENVLHVCISPAVFEGNKVSYDLHNIDCHPQPNADGISIRKPPHCWGWDIMPRAVSAGIWRDVYLYEKKPIAISQFHYHVLSADKDNAKIRFLWELNIENELLKKDIYINIHGKCNESEFKIKEKIYFKLGKAEIEIKKPYLWWPAGYGDASIYDTQCEIYLEDTLIDSRMINVGVRTVSLERTATTDGINGRFAFIINGVQVMCKGTNWVPLDVFHSQDASKYQKALDLLKDINCNMVRCWGGNVYEQDCFYDFCDKNGIMVWQDFGMACAGYSQQEAFCKEIEHEAVSIVRKLRTHPSIVLWSGDNECDAVMSEFGANPIENRLTREVLPKVIYNNDMGRPYLPSSPCFDGDTYKTNNYEILSEYHLWGPRDYFKSSYYSQSKAHFVSEIGYHGCPMPESLEKFIDDDCLWPNNNEQWILHSSDQRNNPARVDLVTNQIKQLFGNVPGELSDYALASQISQAEAKKYFIERIRCKKPIKSGVIWWNLLDGWPQISDAVVDYYGTKKLAYNYIKCSQQDFVIMADEIENWKIKIVASNDTLSEVSGRVSVFERETGETLYEGEFSVGENANKVIAEIPVMYSDKRLLTFEWETEAGKGFNHYITGTPAFSFDVYKNKWLPQIIKLQEKYL